MLNVSEVVRDTDVVTMYYCDLAVSKHRSLQQRVNSYYPPVSVQTVATVT